MVGAARGVHGTPRIVRRGTLVSGSRGHCIPDPGTARRLLRRVVLAGEPDRVSAAGARLAGRRAARDVACRAPRRRPPPGVFPGALRDARQLRGRSVLGQVRARIARGRTLEWPVAWCTRHLRRLDARRRVGTRARAAARSAPSGHVRRVGCRGCRVRSGVGGRPRAFSHGACTCWPSQRASAANTSPCATGPPSNSRS